MTNILSFIPRVVKAKGAVPSIICEDVFQRYLLDDEMENILLLKQIPTQHLPFEKPMLLYPGCGTDLLFPLLYIERLFPESREAVCIFIDRDNYLPMIKTILDDLNISFAERKNELQFYWKKCFINLHFVREDIFNMLDRLPEFNIYFERAFRIMKEKQPNYEQRIYDSLMTKGVIISDSGFRQFPLQRVNVPPQLSSYGEMIMGIKSHNFNYNFSLDQRT